MNFCTEPSWDNNYICVSAHSASKLFECLMRLHWTWPVVQLWSQNEPNQKCWQKRIHFFRLWMWIENSVNIIEIIVQMAASSVHSHWLLALVFIHMLPIWCYTYTRNSANGVTLCSYATRQCGYIQQQQQQQQRKVAHMRNAQSLQIFGRPWWVVGRHEIIYLIK